jgi:hypothetical protein
MSIEQTFEKVTYVYRNGGSVYYVLAERDPRSKENLEYYITRDGKTLEKTEALSLLETFKSELALASEC